MAGYCVELYKYMRVDEDDIKKDTLVEKRNKILDDEKQIKYGNFLAYGEFDRIGIERVERFSRFRDVSKKARTWIGDHQTVLIYEINADRDSVIYEDNNFYERSGSELKLSKQLFVGFTILQFKFFQKRENLRMSEFLCDCQEQILSLVENEYPDVKCSVLGTLGSFGLTIFWLTDQYIDVLNAVTKIRNIEFGRKMDGVQHSAFLSSYTIFAQNHPLADEVEKAKRKKKIHEISGQAMLHITLKCGVNKEILKKIREACQITEKHVVLHSAGEYDITVKMQSSKAFFVFQSEEPLYCESDFFQKYILQTSLQLCECIVENMLEVPLAEAEDIQQGNRLPFPLLDDIQNNYKELRSEFKVLFPSTAGMVDTLDLLYSDYIAKISTASNEMWESIFSYQFCKILDCLNSFIKFIRREDRIPLNHKGILKIINELLGDFERQISHIAESNNLVLGTPTCQFRYSGNNNLTLYAYFGFIKRILDFVYQHQDKSNQAEIIPMIVADIVPIIQSTLFIDYHNKDDSRILTIKLPMGALYNPVFYFPFLYHEIFHYVVPKDRFIRNRVNGMLLSIEILNSLTKDILKKQLKCEKKKQKQLELFVNGYLLKYAYFFVVSRFENYIDPMHIEKIVQRDEANQVIKSAEEYEEELFFKWIKWINQEEKIQLKDNPVYLYLLYLYKNRDRILEEFNKWKTEELYEIDRGDNEETERMKQLLADLRKINDRVDYQLSDKEFVSLMNLTNDDVTNNALFLLKAIKEAMADIAMVQLCNMEFAEYLLIFTKNNKDLTIDVQKICGKEIQDIIRVGIVLEFLCKDNMSSGDRMGCIQGAKKAFVSMYCGLYVKIHANNNVKYMEEAEQWFAYWVQCYQLYCIRYSIYAGLFKELWQQSLVMDQRMETVDKYWKDYVRVLKEVGDDIQSWDGSEDKKKNILKGKKLVDETVFALNRCLIHEFQNQRDFFDLEHDRVGGINEKTKDKSFNGYKFEDIKIDKLSLSEELIGSDRQISRNHIWKYKVYSVGELGTIIVEIAEQLKQANRKIRGNKECPIWYRGHQSAGYQLLPSIMRKFRDYELSLKNGEDATLYKMIRKQYEEFKFRADGIYEVIDRMGYTDSDYIALMQHYSVASNFLDWTEDALSSLYFALEGFMDERVSQVDNDAALYVFSPVFYNFVRKKMMEQVRINDGRTLEIEKMIVNDVPEDIPNLTAPYNSGKYDVYMLGNEKFKEDNIKTFSWEILKDKVAYYAPMAIYTSRLNRRIQAQNGMFLAYNIHTPREREKGFSYVSLEEVQEYYLNKFKDDEQTSPFMYKIVIQKEKCEEVAEWIKTLGMSKERCYPELSNIGERIMR